MSEKAVVGIAQVTRAAFPDPMAKEGDWSAVDLVAKEPLPRAVTLAEIKSEPRLKGIALVRLYRLSVQSLSPIEFREIIRMARR